MYRLRVGQLLQDLHLGLAELEPHVQHFLVLDMHQGDAEVESLVIILGSPLSIIPAADAEATELDVGQLLLPDMGEPEGLEEVMPGRLVVLLHLLLSMLVEDVLLEVAHGLAGLRADPAGPAALGHQLDVLGVWLVALPHVLVEQVGLVK